MAVRSGAMGQNQAISARIVGRMQYAANRGLLRCGVEKVGLDRHISGRELYWVMGRNTEKHVPKHPGRTELRTRIFPLCLRTKFLETQSPIPVPCSPFVV